MMEDVPGTSLQPGRRSREYYRGMACDICSATADGLHYGAISCRSCNAFFRRAVTYNQRYLCRFDGACVVTQLDRCVCRACRYAKCIEAGMREEAVQPKRDPTGSQKGRQRPPLESSFEEAVVVKLECREDTIEADHIDDFVFNRDFFEGKQFELLVHCYAEHLRMMQLNMTSAEDFLQDHQPSGSLRELDATDVGLLASTELAGILYWFEKLEPFSFLDRVDCRMLLNHYSPRKLTLDRMFIASLHKEEAAAGRIVLLNNSFIAVVDINENNQHVSEKLLLPTFERFWRCAVLPMIEMKITHAEIVFLHCQLLWTDHRYVSNSSRNILQARREWAARCLRKHYERIGQIDPEIRLGEISLLLPELEVICDHHCTDYQVAKLFQFSDLRLNSYDEYCGSTIQ